MDHKTFTKIEQKYSILSIQVFVCNSRYKYEKVRDAAKAIDD